jgi:ABC-type branched-subunit amino acid transport system permease subunit
MSGVLLAPIYSVFPTMGRDFVLIAFSVVIIGGMGSIKGAVIAGLLLTQVQSISSLFISPVWSDPLVFGIMVLVLMWRPQGLFGRLGHGMTRYSATRVAVRAAVSSTSAPTRSKRHGDAGDAFFALALVFAAVAAASGDVFFFRLATEALIFGGLALSVDLLLGRTGLLPLGQALFFGFGAYVSALVLKHWSPSFWAALGVTLVASAAVGLVAGVIAIRAKGVYFALISFGLAQVVSKAVYNTRELGASDGIIGVPAGVSSSFPASPRPRRRVSSSWSLAYIVMLVYLGPRAT